jgi:hypothetical protein
MKWRRVAVSILAVIAFVFGLSAVGIVHYQIFEPWQQNAERKVFEETKSRMHGVTQDLASYHHQWVVSHTIQERRAIEAVIRQRFAAVDPNDINSSVLRLWFIQVLSR